MKYTFKDFNSQELLSDDLRVLFVTGQHSIFVNMMCDKVRNLCKGEEIVYDADLFEDMGIKMSENEIQTSNIVDISAFPDTIVAVPPSGKWYCSVPLSLLTKKQKDWIKNYIKNPSENAVLVLFATEFKDYSEWLKDKTLAMSKYSHIIQLSFPDKNILKDIVKNKFNEHNVEIQNAEIETFIFRMSNAYDDYDSVIENICLDYANEDGHEITKKEMLAGLHGINNCVLDDFIDRLLVPFKNDTPTNRKTIFKMLGALLEEYGAEDLCKRLLKQVNVYIELRQAVNSGQIPVLIKYSLKEVRDRLGEESSLNKISDFRFRKMAYIASRTSLRDWVYMRLILENTSYMNKKSYEEALYRITVRSILNPCMLNYDLNIGGIYDNELSDIDQIRYSEDMLSKAKDLEIKAFESKVEQQKLDMELKDAAEKDEKSSESSGIDWVNKLASEAKDLSNMDNWYKGEESESDDIDDLDGLDAELAALVDNK